MKSSIRPLFLLLLATVAACSGGQEEPGPPAPARTPGQMEPPPYVLEDAAEDFDEVRTGFLEWYFETHPVRASELGMRRYDDRLPELTRAGIQTRIDDLLDWLDDLQGIGFELMRGGDRFDYAVLEYGLRSELLNLEETRDWALNPVYYTDLISRGLAAASADGSPDVLAARLVAGARILDVSRENLRNPPAIWTELAIDDARGLRTYLDVGLPAAVGGELTPALSTARDSFATALDAHITWLEEELLPVSRGNYRLGRYLFERKILYTQHLPLRVEDMEQLNAEALQEYQEEIREVAASIDPDRSVAEVIDSIAALHPAPDSLLAAIRDAVEDARDWVVESGVVALPDDALPEVRASPAFDRAGFVNLVAPGPYADSGEVFLSVTSAQDDWDPVLQAENLGYFNYAALGPLALHSTFPGAYVQAMYEIDHPEVRRVYNSTAFLGGWALYAEGMALDEGFSDDPAVRLMHLRRALQRHGRWHAAIQLHARDVPLEQVVSEFMELAYLPEESARRDVMRATWDPTYGSGALGEMQIRALRDDLRDALAEDDDREFSLPTFHEQLLRLGLPVSLARDAVLASEEPQRPRN